MSTKKETVKRYKSSIKQIKSQLDRFHTFVSSCDESINKVLINERLIKCESLWDEFNKLQLELDYLDEPSDESFSVRNEFENKYFETMCMFKELTTSNMSSNINQVNQASSNNNGAVKLPPLDLPLFDGKYDKWTSFFDTFSALIHSNNNITNVQKFYYLQSCLKGEAAQAISSIAVTDLNYEIAFKLLIDRYENKRLIIQSHLKSLFDMPLVSKNNHTELRKCIDTIQKNVRALKSLQEPIEYWDTILIYIFNLKLDIITKSEWEAFSIKNNALKYNDFIAFLVQRCQVLESVHSATKPNFYERPFEKPKGTTRSMFVSKQQCQICTNGEHFIANCPKFLKITPADRINDIKRLRLCLNCFKSNHLSIKCTQGGCRKCGKPHNTLLHLDFSKSNKNNSNCPPVQGEQSSAVPVEHAADNRGNSILFNSCNINRLEENEVLLSTAMVLVNDRYGKIHEVRAMLDSGSQSNFISSNLVSLLKLNTNAVNMVVVGVNNSASKSTKSVDLEIKSKFCDFLISLKCFVLNKIADSLPTCLIKKEDLKIPSNIFLADSTFNIPGKIDIILGANIFYDLLSVGQIRLAKNMPIFQKTKLGWVISGSAPLKCNKICSEITSESECNTMCSFVTNKVIQKQMEQFWAIEEIQTGKIFKKEERECEDLFINTTTHADDGKFIVELPTKAGIEDLGDSKEIAIHRFNKLEKRLASNDIMKEQYINFMKEYESLGHMTLIPDDEIKSKNVTYYIPHHPVLKETSSTTKLRVVFDASAKTTKGISLNEKLKSGPVIQDELFPILIRFREHTYVIGADVEKMYRQVWIKQEQRELQRIVWRDSAEERLRHYRLNTVTYGTTPASYLAIRSLHMAAEEQEHIFPNASKEIKKNFYVDDLLTGTSSIEEAIKLKEEISDILKKAGFILRKWVSNEREILDKSEDEDIKYYIVEEKITKTLGLAWNIQRDSLQYFVQIQNNLKLTKRNILSAISRLFDPLGLIGPIITTAKILMQGLWNENLGWDDEVSKELGESWIQFYQDLPILNEFNIARHALCSESVIVELHGFCDSSERAYGACIYFRSVNNSGEIQSHVVCAKSRVAPMKTLTLPRLELCGAVLLTRLMNKTVNSLININVNKICYWTDSKIVLAWIAVEAANWNVFVSHRVAEVQQTTDINNWRHVSSEENPADLISRGCSPNKLINSKLWWHGPHWLTKSAKHWPSAELNAFQDIEVPEKRVVKRAFVSIPVNQDIFYKFSTLYKLQRVVAYCFRFYKNITSLKENKITGGLSVCELEQALICLIKLAQGVMFGNEINAVKLKKNISKNSKLNSLNPFLDKDNILRVGGRLSKALISYNQKYPIILDKNHVLSKLIIENEHKRNLHLGPQNLLCHIRCKFWILGGINTIKKVLRSCIVCFRVKPRTFNTIMGELPEPRLVPTKPFFNSGVDYAGPFNIKSSSLRNAKILKAYLCIFVCFVTKAVHLEVVSDLTTESFLNALKRFIARRGKCQGIFSDCGTNFVGASQAMKDFFKFLNEKGFKNKLTEYLAQDGIKWNFIPPRSPHFGGLWESHVKIAKTQLKKVVGNAALNFEELTTIFSQIEACMNSRPLSPLSSDPLDFSPLTPGHFLTGESLIAFPEQDVREIKCNRLNRYQYLKQLVQHFWDRWYREYLSELNRRLKWKYKGGDNVKVGDMVILKDENVPPLKWPLGRVESVFPGTDNIVRVVLVKTAKGSFKRAVSKICVLPMET